MSNALEKKITLSSLIRYTLPTVAMMVFFSLYTVIDGMFISRFVGVDALSAVNIVYPIIYLLLGVGVMFATGGSAIVARLMGEGKDKEAKEGFTIITITSLVVGGTISLVSITFIKPIIYTLGANEQLYNYCHQYLFSMLIFTPFIILKIYADYFLVTAGVPKLGLISSIGGGIINIVLDYVFIVNLDMGVAGAGFATGIGYMVPSLVGIIHFFKKSSTVHFTKAKFNLNVIKESCINGSSEMVTQLSTSVTTFLYNIVIMKFLGAGGVASITIILYIQFLINGVYLGFTSGTAPRISYNYGSKNEEEIKKLVKYSFLIVSVFGLATFTLSRVFSEVLITIFVEKSNSLYNITLDGLMIFSYGFLFAGLNIFITGMFTAFSNGKISAMLSLCRTFILFIIGIIILPKIFGLKGVWLVVPISELLALIISMTCVYTNKEKYMYSKIFKKPNKKVAIEN